MGDLKPYVSKTMPGGPVLLVGSVLPIGPVTPVAPVEPVGPVGNCKGGTGGRVGPIKPVFNAAENKNSSNIIYL